MHSPSQSLLWMPIVLFIRSSGFVKENAQKQQKKLRQPWFKLFYLKLYQFTCKSTIRTISNMNCLFFLSNFSIDHFSPVIILLLAKMSLQLLPTTCGVNRGWVIMASYSCQHDIFVLCQFPRLWTSPIFILLQVENTCEDGTYLESFTGLLLDSVYSSNFKMTNLRKWNVPCHTRLQINGNRFCKHEWFLVSSNWHMYAKVTRNVSRI